MKIILVSATLLLLLNACHRKPDGDPPTSTTTTTVTSPNNQPPQPPPPVVTSCQGATIVNALNVFSINDNSTKTVALPNFDLSCGDSVTVFIRNPLSPPGQGWSELFNVNNGASYYELNGQSITIHNSTGIIVDCQITETLK